jgi:hypothetical protein
VRSSRLSTTDSERQSGGGGGAIARHPRASRRSLHRPVASTDGSLTEKLNETGVRLGTDIPPTTVHTKAGVQRVLVCSENTHPAGDNATPLSVSNAVELRLNVIANRCNQHVLASALAGKVHSNRERCMFFNQRENLRVGCSVQRRLSRATPTTEDSNRDLDAA